jgi:hypothetical protein
MPKRPAIACIGAPRQSLDQAISGSWFPSRIHGCVHHSTLGMGNAFNSDSALRQNTALFYRPDIVRWRVQRDPSGDRSGTQVIQQHQAVPACIFNDRTILVLWQKRWRGIARWIVISISALHPAITSFRADCAGMCSMIVPSAPVSGGLQGDRFSTMCSVR